MAIEKSILFLIDMLADSSDAVRLSVLHALQLSVIFISPKAINSTNSSATFDIRDNSDTDTSLLSLINIMKRLLLEMKLSVKAAEDALLLEIESLIRSLATLDPILIESLTRDFLTNETDFIDDGLASIRSICSDIIGHFDIMAQLSVRNLK